jgi:hypothetical protein
MQTVFHKDHLLTGRLNNDDGTVIITALLILMLLTFIAFTATHTTRVEKAIVRSEAVTEQTFYLAESGAMEAIQKMENQDDPNNLLPDLLTIGSPNVNLLRKYQDPDDANNDLSNLDQNVAAGGDNDGVIDPDDFGETADIDTDTTFRAVVLTKSSGDSLRGGTSRTYSYLSYGYSEAQSGRSLIKVGYKKRF